MKVPAGQLRDVLGITHVSYLPGRHSLAVVDAPLASTGASNHSSAEVKIADFSFGPKSLRVKIGSVVRWTNGDDIPHNVLSVEKKFASPVLDTGQAFSFTFEQPGTYPYFCKMHPMMTGTILVGNGD